MAPGSRTPNPWRSRRGDGRGGELICVRSRCDPQLRHAAPRASTRDTSGNDARRSPAPAQAVIARMILAAGIRLEDRHEGGRAQRGGHGLGGVVVAVTGGSPRYPTSPLGRSRTSALNHPTSSRRASSEACVSGLRAAHRFGTVASNAVSTSTTSGGWSNTFGDLPRGILQPGHSYT